MVTLARGTIPTQVDVVATIHQHSLLTTLVSPVELAMMELILLFLVIHAPMVAELTPSVILAPGTMPTQVVAETTIPDHGPQLLHAALVEVVMRFKLLPQLLLQMTHAPMVVELILTEILAPGTMPTQADVETTIPDHGLQLPHAAPVEEVKRLTLLPQLLLQMTHAPMVAELTPSVILAPGTMPTQVDVETTIPHHGLQLLLAALVEEVPMEMLPQLHLAMEDVPMT